MEKENCPFCYKSFDPESAIPRRVPVCKHSFCEPCLLKLIAKNPHDMEFICPFDRNSMLLRSEGFKDFPINLAALEKATKRKLDIIRLQDVEFEEEINDDYLTKELEELWPLIQKKREETQAKLSKGRCKLHQRPLELICLQDKKRICTDCALFGDHLNHKVKSCPDLLSEEHENLKTMLECCIELKSQLLSMSGDDGLPSSFQISLLELIKENERRMTSKIRRDANVYIFVKPQEAS